MTAAPRICLLSTYPPTSCGLATFSESLRRHLADTGSPVSVVRVVDDAPPGPVPGVLAHLVNGSQSSALAAVRVMNGFDAVVVHHEYGIYGGPDGWAVLDLVDQLTVPAVVVLHTVLRTPSARQRAILLQLLDRAAVVVVLTHTARDRLVRHYGGDPARIQVVPHGAAVAGGQRRRSARVVGRRRPVVLTWGLIGPGKGIEWAIEALAGLRDLQPRYLVVGRTHPKVVEHEGERYRDALVARATAAGVSDLVEFVDGYLGAADLAGLLAGADVVLLPYDSVEQVTSGVLVEAVAAGRPVVATSFPHAVELLTAGPGLLVPRQDPAAIATALRRVLTDDALAGELAASAARQAGTLAWSSVAAAYRRIAASLGGGAVAGPGGPADPVRAEAAPTPASAG